MSSHETEERISISKGRRGISHIMPWGAAMRCECHEGWRAACNLSTHHGARVAVLTESGRGGESGTSLMI